MKHICFFGDGLTQGQGDSHQIGWPERLAAHERSRHGSKEGTLASSDITAYGLGVAWDTSLDIQLRWHDEAMVRLVNREQAGVVFCFGLADMASVDGEGLQVSLWDSAAHAEALMASASVDWPVLWLGPTPVRPHPAPVLFQGQRYQFSAVRLQALNDAYADVARRLGIPYLDLLAILPERSDWSAALQQGGGVFPRSAGHQAIADVVAQWGPWRRWMDRGVGGGSAQRYKELPPGTLLTPKMVAAGY